MRRLALALLCLALAACSSAPKKPSPPAAGHAGTPARADGAAAAGRDCSRYAPAQEDPSTRGDYRAGGLYKPGVADATPEHVPDLDCIAEPRVTDEPPSVTGNRSPYKVLGKSYKVLASAGGYVERGKASYYGQKFHGRLTSNREVYDMYAYTAAHKTLPLPSFARVTNLDNGKSVVVRVNDRGPFHDGRIIDLSYAAAVKLGITARGTGNVEVRGLSAKDAAGSTRTDAAPAPEQRPVRAPAVAEMPATARLWLQVASYASRDNAERALARLNAADITGAQISDIVSKGRTLWRLRVGAADAASAEALATRIAVLGFGQPQRVRE